MNLINPDIEKPPRVVILGGFTDSTGRLEKVGQIASALRRTDDVEWYTMRKALKSEKDLQRDAAGAEVYAHSAGVLAVPHSVSIDRLRLIAPLEPRTRRHHVSRAAKKVMDYAFVRRNLDHYAVLAGNARELFGPDSVTGNMRPLINGKISQFSTYEEFFGVNRDRMIHCDDIGYLVMQNDVFFGPPDETILSSIREMNQAEQEQQAVRGFAKLFWEGILKGGHDALLTDPAITLVDIFKLEKNARLQSASR